MAEKSNESLLIGARPLNLAEMVCRRLVDGVRIMDGALLLDADPAWAGAINTVLVKSGVRVSELRRADRLWTVCPPSTTARSKADSFYIHRHLLS